MISYSAKLSVEEYCDLRASVGWMELVEEQATALLNHSDYIVSCHDGNSIVGCARVFWDKGYIAYLADVMVKPEYQGQGIGKSLVSACIHFIDSQLQDGWRIKIVILSAKGKEAFYEKLGFKIRPNNYEGAGMTMWRE